MRFQQNQRNKLKEHFKDHVFYKLCRRIHDAFLKHCPTIIVSSEELFVDAAETLDELLTERDIKAERCSELWSEKLSINRRDDANCVDMATSQADIIRKTKCFRILERNAIISKTKRNFSRLYPTPQKIKKNRPASPERNTFEGS